MNKEITLKFSIQSSESNIDNISKELTIFLQLPAGLNFPEHAGQNPADMVENFFWMTCLSIAKGLTYGDSWKKHGPVFSIFPNCLRKVDRVESGLKLNMPDSITDGAADAVVYFELLLQWIQAEHPDEYKEWIQNDVFKYLDKYCGTRIQSSKEK